MGSNYAPTVDIQNKASEKGLHQVLWLYGEDHQLTEAGTMNIFMVSLDENGGNLNTYYGVITLLFSFTNVLILVISG